MEIGAFSRVLRGARGSYPVDRLAARADAVFPDSSSRASTRQAVAVTFDDAFQSVFDHALPVMVVNLT